MSHTQNITVAVRVRPVLQYELNKTPEIAIGTNNQVVILENKTTLKFDKVYGEQSTQQVIYDELTQPALDSFLNGYSCSVMAYGQTSSGKSYTMGIPDKKLFQTFPNVNADTGLIPRSISYIFDQLNKKKNQYVIKIQYIEVYNEQLKDLLTTEETQIQIREKLQNGYFQIYTTGANEVYVKNAREALSCFVNGGQNRTTASTALNEQSSRSHSIFTFSLEQVLETGEILKSKLNLVDLAGSERIAKSGSTGQQFKEMVGINQGLLCLGNVIKILSDRTKQITHVPYRDSKLTRLLQDSIGGSSRCVFIACVSPSKYNYDESQITLKYAARARNIVNKPVRIVERAVQDEAAFQKLADENLMLKDCINTMCQKQQQQDEEINVLKSHVGDYTSSSKMQQSINQQSQSSNQQQMNLNNTNQNMNMSQTLQTLLNQPQMEVYREKLEHLNQKTAQNQFYNVGAASQLYNHIINFQLKYFLQNNVSIAQLQQYDKLINDNQVNIQNESHKLLFQTAAFILQYLEYESQYEKQLLVNQKEKQINFSDVLFTNQQDIQQLISQTLNEINFTNKLKQELKENYNTMTLNANDPARFATEDQEQARSFYQNQMLMKERLQIITKEEEQLDLQIQEQRQRVVVLDVDDEFQQVEFETDMVSTQQVQQEADDYDFQNYDYIHQKSEYNDDQQEDEEIIEQEQYQNDQIIEQEIGPEVSLNKKFDPSITELSRKLHSLENRMEDRNKALSEKIQQKQGQLSQNNSEFDQQQIEQKYTKSGVQQSPYSIKQQPPQLKVLQSAGGYRKEQSPVNLRQMNKSQSMSVRSQYQQLQPMPPPAPNHKDFVVPKVDQQPNKSSRPTSSSRVLQRQSAKK